MDQFENSSYDEERSFVYVRMYFTHLHIDFIYSTRFHFWLTLPLEILKMTRKKNAVKEKFLYRNERSFIACNI